MIDFTRKERYDIHDLEEIVRLLRSPDGCPWDREQTHQSIRRNFLEETYECCEAIDNDDAELMKEELGDVLLQVLFHADIEKDRGRFTLDDVCDGVCKKLVFRHPNVFGDPTEQTWEDMKELEKGQKTFTDTMDAVARTLPALWRAEKVVKKGGKSGFIWPDTRYAIRCLERDVETLRKTEWDDGDLEAALGQVLLAAATVGLIAGIDSEMALHKSCETYIHNFAAMEQWSARYGRRLERRDPAWMLGVWYAIVENDLGKETDIDWVPQLEEQEKRFEARFHQMALEYAEKTKKEKERGNKHEQD